jgi:REP element-mobilizing transposase RayT
MIHGYHAIFGTYGFWMPNDPRGSWSDFVGKYELIKFGKATKSITRVIELSPEEKLQLDLAKAELMYPPVVLSDDQVECVARGLQDYIERTPIELWACAILPDHTHLVFGRHRMKSEQIVRMLKGSATKQLKKDRLHPLAQYRKSDGSIPSPWSVGKWIQYLDSEQGIDDAIRYVEANPTKEGRPRQMWPFVRPFAGLNLGAGWLNYQ